MQIVNSWIQAARLRTLPLAMASIGMGAFLAASINRFNLMIFVLSALTTIFLQILSNFSNDYGDSFHGVDGEHREGPVRTVQSGAISAKAMKTGMVVTAVLALGFGVWLLMEAFTDNAKELFLFLGIGMLSILAAITYTSGAKPYGYAGLGDLSVFLFFGIVGVLGSFYLHTHIITWQFLLPACTCGLFSTAVLNVNNIRDIKTDALSGKKSVPVRLGRENAVIYHWILLILGVICSIAYIYFNFKSYYQWLFLLCIPLLFVNGLAVQQKQTAQTLDPYLKQMALSTLLYVLTFGIGNLL